jgi:hypothetical protein
LDGYRLFKWLRLKLVVWKGGERSNRLVKVGSQFQSRGCAWLSTGWAPTEDDYLPKGGFVGGEYGFSRMAVSFVPETCLVYAGISGGILSETSIMVKDIQEKGLSFEHPLVMKSVWKRLLRGVLEPGDTIYVAADRDYVFHCFEKYGSWMSDSWSFLMSRTPITNWAQQVHFASRGIITDEFLRNFELFFRNRWEHGFEVLSCKFTYDQLKEMAKDAASNLKWGFVEAADSSVETLRRLKVW